MNLAIVSQYYPPEVGAPQARLSELAAHFVNHGHHVTVLTAMPNYPTGTVYPGYGGWLRRERLEGVEVIRTFIYPTKAADFSRRLTNYFSFVASSIVIGSAILPRPDYLLVESPPLFSGFSGTWLNWMKGARLIFNVSDLWPESAVRLDLIKDGGMAHRLASLLEAFFYKNAWLITGQSKSILANISKRFPQQKVFHLSNGVDTQKFGPIYRTEEVRRKLATNGECVALYAGLHGLAQGLDQVLMAARMLRGDKDFSFTLIGDGPEKQNLQTRARNDGLTNVRFVDAQPASEIPAFLASSDLALVILKIDIPGAVPSKLYEAMASARPVVLVAQGEAAEIVQNHEAGIVVTPGDIDGLAHALRTLRENPELRRTMGANGRRTVERLFNRKDIASRFREYLEANLDLKDEGQVEPPR
ncbi:MAG TPA: glycosyltransferase family 4 protein [Pyrinomonadaceae bacterium]|nr:glycosyltransferase family 4 protein [Pyrinomonadaceae bacterium]